MGDSLIAGNGALEEWALGTMIEYRGVSWCAGVLILQVTMAFIISYFRWTKHVATILNSSQYSQRV